MKAHNREQIDQFWADELGLGSSIAITPHICCTVQHLYSGVRLYSSGERLIIASPPARAEFIQEAVANVSPAEAFSVDWLQRIFADEAEKILGPAEVNYADETNFRSEQGTGGRALSASDSAAYRALVAAL